MSTACDWSLVCTEKKEIGRKFGKDSVWTQERPGLPWEGEKTHMWPPESCSGKKRKSRGCIKQFLHQRIVAKSGLLCKAPWARS